MSTGKWRLAITAVVVAVILGLTKSAANDSRPDGLRMVSELHPHSLFMTAIIPSAVARSRTTWPRNAQTCPRATRAQHPRSPTRTTGAVATVAIVPCQLVPSMFRSRRMRILGSRVASISVRTQAGKTPV